MTVKKKPPLRAILFSLSFALSVYAQGPGIEQQLQQQQQQLPVYMRVQGVPQLVGPVAQSKDETEALIGLQKEQSANKRIELADAFVAKYPGSDFVQEAHTFRVYAYAQLGKTKESIAAAEQAIDTTIKFRDKLIAKADTDAKLTALEKEDIKKKDKDAVFLVKNSPQFITFVRQSEQRILGFYQTIIQGYQQLNDPAKVMESGERVIRFKPDEISTLMMVSNALAERPPANEQEKTRQMQRAEQLANQALSLLPGFMATEGARIPEEFRGETPAQMHYTLGLIYFHQKKLGSSQQEFLTAIKSRSKHPETYYRLGMAYEQDKKEDQAMEALGKSVFLKGTSEAEARAMLEKLYVRKNKSADGLEDYVKACGAKIGQ